MAKLDRMLALVHRLSEAGEGLTLDEMAATLGVNRRTAERMRDVIREHFDLDERQDDRVKRFFIRESLRRVYTRPTAAEVAALRVEADARRAQKASHAAQLESLLSKVQSALDDRERGRMAPDLEALARLQRSRVTAGPAVVAEPEALAAIQRAIMEGSCLEFDYRADGMVQPAWRRVIPYGLLHGPITYLVGKQPNSDKPPVHFRLDRMSGVRASNLVGEVPGDWDLDAWMAQSFGIWREEDYDIVLRVTAPAVERARHWRFHPAQQSDEDGDELVIRFRSGGLREIAEHLFQWGGEVRIEEPKALRDVMMQRLTLGMAAAL